MLVYSVSSAACAEQIAAFGAIGSGWLAGQTAWPLLFLCSCLSALYALTVIAARWNGRVGTLLLRLVLLIGFFVCRSVCA
ncbi:hypothetical protein [uncultured Algimonas sp.]|uniref:hypothetical protein n=1 Tax=uncultured Algimonas sp. TaxID=1547920 RepID=UPI00261A704F|nr:hypothetical protein [uncultured Algimonas sp.]